MTQPIVLVADDELFFRRLYAESLSDDHYRIETIDSGEAAVARIKQGGIDLVVTDLVMPGMDGLEVLRQARALENPPEVILATGNATLETAIKALKNGARDYLIKPFNPEELRHLVRTCLEQRRLLDENHLLKRQIRLFQKGQDLASLIELERLLAQSIDTLLRETDGGRGFAFLAGNQKVEKLFSLNQIEELPANHLAQSLCPFINDLQGMKVLHQDDFPPESELPEDMRQTYLFPLKCDQAVKGALVLLNPEGQELQVSPLENLLFLAEQAGIGFDNAYRYQGARELIYTDDLTGLYNQRYLSLALDQEIRRSERYGLEFSIIFLDVENFKKINDTHGHLAGSSALKEVAKLLRASIREVDIPFRYGGDEFTALLVETGISGAEVVAERVRKAIEEHIFLQPRKQDSRLTATVGYSTFPIHAKDRKTILELADQAMYEGKRNRNVICSAAELLKP